MEPLSGLIARSRGVCFGAKVCGNARLPTERTVAPCLAVKRRIAPLGGAFGYTASHNSVTDASSRMSVDSYTATVFGGKNFESGPGNFRFTAGAPYTWHEIDAKRNVALGGQRQRLKLSYNVSSTQVLTELGYKLPLGEAYAIEPFAGVAWNHVRTRDFQ
ncbi:Extracellular serine protease precursor [compost metagenome]